MYTKIVKQLHVWNISHLLTLIAKNATANEFQ